MVIVPAMPRITIVRTWQFAPQYHALLAERRPDRFPARAEQRKDRQARGGGQMHGAAVAADEESALPEQCDQFRQRQAIAEIDRRRIPKLPVFKFSLDARNDIGVEPSGADPRHLQPCVVQVSHQPGEMLPGPQLVAHAGAGMNDRQRAIHAMTVEQDSHPVGQFRRHLEIKRARRRFACAVIADDLAESVIAMSQIVQVEHIAVEPSRAFRQRPDSPPAAAEPGDGARKALALHVDQAMPLVFAQFPEKTQVVAQSMGEALVCGEFLSRVIQRPRIGFRQHRQQRPKARIENGHRLVVPLQHAQHPGQPEHEIAQIMSRKQQQGRLGHNACLHNGRKWQDYHR